MSKIVYNRMCYCFLQKKPGSADILRSMEMFALQAAIRLPREDIKKPFITNNMSKYGL